MVVGGRLRWEVVGGCWRRWAVMGCDGGWWEAGGDERVGGGGGGKGRWWQVMVVGGR